MRCDIPHDRSTTTRQVIDRDAVLLPIDDVHVYFNQVVNGTLSICWEVWEFTRVRCLSCRCKLIVLYVHYQIICKTSVLCRIHVALAKAKLAGQTDRPMTYKVIPMWCFALLVLQ